MDFDRHRQLLADKLGSRYAPDRVASWRTHGSEADVSRQRAVLSSISGYKDNLARNVADGRSLLLYGTAGTGKDHILASLIWAATDAGIYVRHVSGPELIDDLKSSIKSGAASGKLRQFQTVPVLALSDPVTGDGSLSEYEKRVMFDLFDCRYRSGRPHWVTANIRDDKDGQSRIGSQVWDRIVGDAVVLKCEWESFRRPQQVVGV